MKQGSVKSTERRLVRGKGPELLAYFGAVLSDQLEKKGHAPHEANEIAVDVMEHLRGQFGGQNIYFPMGESTRNEEKAAEVYDKWQEGTPIADLAHEYGHSIQWIYRLIADERARRRVERDAQAKARRVSERDRWKREN